MSKGLFFLGGALIGFGVGYVIKSFKRSEIMPMINTELGEIKEVESQEIDCSKYKKFSAFININSLGSPGLLLIEVFFWNGQEFEKYEQDFWGSLFYSQSMMPIAEALSGDILGNSMIIKATSFETSIENSYQLNINIQMS